MKINFTKKQYKDLLKLVYLGNWMANATKIDNKIKKFNDLESYVFSFAKNFGVKELTHNENSKRYYPSADFESDEEIQTIIEDYNEEGFWDELIGKLTDIAMTKRFSEKKIKKMSRKEYMKYYFRMEAEITKYIEEKGLGDIYGSL